ncbi:MAG: glycosyltransferase [Saprospiraceae bacterium]|nr:glycosyltransferase [Saprospiraceae bacterium]MCB9326532.1 glycosyltransferase [Lewinellaceae bacterium]
MDLSVIIVNYNVRYFLEQALLSVRKASRGLKVEIFVVDNNSVDDSVAMVKEKFPEVLLIANTDNPGFSIANNQAIRQSTGKYVLLLNPDTIVEEDTFEKCLKFMDSHPEAGGLGVRMIDGSGKFLPESKRGFPTPFVAFAKSFGLSRIFPKSKLFNHYHLGYLDEFETNEIEVLAGAFMLMRRSVLDEVGLLDEAFFMYGEDIDLSYRIIQGGYKNYYFPETSILHYKGESTKKGSLNYVKAFYNAMIIFAKKHFHGQQARFFVFMLQWAIYFRAFITLAASFFKRAAQPMLDAVLMYGGLYFLKNFWASYHFKQPDYYDDSLLYFNFPLYILIWITTIYFSGGYDPKASIGKVVRGVLAGTVILAAIYGFLNLEYRHSRALILLGAAWSLMATTGSRILQHFIKNRNFKLSEIPVKNLVIVGTLKESERVLHLLHQVQVKQNFIGTVASETTEDTNYLSSLHQLQEVAHIYKIDTVIFCGKDVAAQDIMQWMTRLGPSLEYKIVPEESMSIIGSSSKNTAGELYTIDIQFHIAENVSQRNKRLTDLFLCGFLLVSLPIQLIIVKNKRGLLKNIVAVFSFKKSWVGYAHSENSAYKLPKIKPGVLSPLDRLYRMKTLSHESFSFDESTVNRLNFFYAKDYHPMVDMDIVWKGWRNLGN